MRSVPVLEDCPRLRGRSSAILQICETKIQLVDDLSPKLRDQNDPRVATMLEDETRSSLEIFFECYQTCAAMTLHEN